MTTNTTPTARDDGGGLREAVRADIRDLLSPDDNGDRNCWEVADAAIAAMTRLGWTCAGPGDGAGQGVPVFAEIAAERARQDAKWGGPGHDDEHGPDDWDRFIAKRCCFPAAPADFRQRMVEVASLAVAAMQSHDRKWSGVPRLTDTTSGEVAAPVAPACGISEGVRETILAALSWYVPNMGDAPERATAEIEAKVAEALAELDGIPVLGAGK